MLTAAVGVGCGAADADSSGARSPERQSSAEYDLAKDYFYKGQPRAALDHIRHSVELEDDNSKALYFASIIYMSFCASDTGFQSPDCNLPEAEKYARQALKAQEDFRDARNALGQILIDEGKLSEAIQTLTPLVKDPAYSASHLAWGNLGWAQVKLGDLDAGITSLKNAIATDPQFCVGHYRLGRAYEKKGDFPHAEESFTNALSVENEACRKLQDAYEGRAEVRVKLQNIEGAREDYSKCKDLLPTSKAGQSCTRMLADLSGSQAPGPAASGSPLSGSPTP